MKQLAPILLLLVSDLGATNPVSVSLTAPTNGSTVSGTVTLTATAGSTMGPITRVEYIMDPGTPTQQVVAVWTDPIPRPNNLRITSLSP